ncbi:DUF3422 domain-containing protein [Pseudomonas syringae]|nr:DUF3422 domain-containing protein [Pseudomonas syringae]
MHPHRIRLHNELHARPSIYFEGPACAFHVAFVLAGDLCEPLLKHLTGQDSHPAHGFVDRDPVRYKWERHGEFLTISAVLPTYDSITPWPAFPSLLTDLMAQYAHCVINAMQVQVIEERPESCDLSRYGFHDPAGSAIGQCSATLWSDFVLTPEGVCRLVLVNRSLNAYRLGRMVRRVLELETYRMMALLALPQAQALGVELDRFEERLSNLTQRTAQLSQGETRLLLDDIARLSTHITHCTVSNQQRLAATAAYANLVDERIAELRETHAGDCQRLGVFIERRFRPSVRYCAVVRERLAQLAQGVARLSDLLQARAQVELEEQNGQILLSLNRRADTQIRIQKAVEGVSVIAITYYLLSLLKLIYQGGEALGVELSAQLAVLACIPVTLAVLWHSRRKIRDTA